MGSLKILATFLLAITVVTTASCERPTVSFDPAELMKMTEEDERLLVLTISNYTEYEGATINTFLSDERVLEIEPTTLLVDFANCSDVGDECNVTFTVRAKFLGYCDATFKIMWTNDSNEDTLVTYKTSVLRKQHIWTTVFSVFMGVLVSINYINMGVQLDMKIVLKVLKRPVGPIIGFLCQFTCMPLAAFLYGYVFLRDENLFRMALLAIGCSPGGSSSNFWTLLFKGDINLSVTMTFISTISSLGMMPLWLTVIGPLLFRDIQFQIPFDRLFIVLVTLTTPLFVGIAVQRFLPKVAAISRKVIRPMTIVVVLVGMIAGSVMNHYIFLFFTWNTAAAGACVAVTGYVVGAAFSWLGRLTPAQIKAVSIETAIQNTSIPLVLLITSMGQPEADIVIVPGLLQMMITTVPLWFLYLGVRIKRCCSRKKTDDGKETELPEKTRSSTQNGEIKEKTRL